MTRSKGTDARSSTQKLSALATALADVAGDASSTALILSATGEEGPKWIEELIKLEKVLKPFKESPPTQATPPNLRTVAPKASQDAVHQLPTEAPPSNAAINASKGPKGAFNQPVNIPWHVGYASSVECAHGAPFSAPELHNEGLATAVFTHIGTNFETEFHGYDSNYERLEFLGDAYVEIICTRLIYDRFPDLPVGRLAKLRESLVRNDRLAEYAVLHNFHIRARLPDGMRFSCNPQSKVFADIFEAYVAAVILQSPENGFATAEAWLGSLWEPRFRMTHGVPEANKLAKQQLATKIMTPKIKIDYSTIMKPVKWHDKKATYFAEALLTGYGYKKLQMGVGGGTSIGEAGNDAAANALTNKSLLKQILQRRKHQEAQRAKEQAEKDQALKAEDAQSAAEKQGPVVVEKSVDVEKEAPKESEGLIDILLSAL